MKLSNMVKKTKAYADATRSSVDRFREGSSVIDSIKGTAVDFKKAGLADCVNVYRFIQSPRFDGYKRFRVSYRGYEPAEDGLKQFHRIGAPLDDAEILLNPVSRGGYQLIEVFVNGFRIGSVFYMDDRESARFIGDKLLAGLVTDAHVKFEVQTSIGKGKFGLNTTKEEDVIYLFLRADGESDG